MSEEWSLDDAMRAMREGERIRAKHEKYQAECNLDLLPERCKVCGHVPKLSGGIASGRIKVCQHQLDWMRDNLPKAEPQPNPFGFSSFGAFDGLAIDVVDVPDNKADEVSPTGETDS